MISYSSTILADSPQAYYRLDQTSGNIAFDASGHGYNGTLSGVSAYSQVGALTGDPNTSTAFTGNGGMQVPTTLNYTTWSAFSLEFWINVSGSWQYVVATCNGGTTIVYLNGNVVTPSSPAPIEISSIFDWAGSAQACNLDEIGIYNTVLSPTQVSNHYRAGVVTTQQMILNDTPRAYYRLDETSGTIAHDLTTNAYNGTIIGGVTLAQPGALGNDPDTAMLFNGSTGYITLPSALNVAYTAFSAEMWVKVKTSYPSGTYACLLGSSDPATTVTGFQIEIAPVGDTALAYFNTGNGTTNTGVSFGSAPPVLNTWYHLVATFDGTTLRSYVNGVVSGGSTPGTAPGTIAASPTVPAIGRNQTSASLYANAIVDEVALYNYVLSGSQIQNHYLTSTATTKSVATRLRFVSTSNPLKNIAMRLQLTLTTVRLLTTRLRFAANTSRLLATRLLLTGSMSRLLATRVRMIAQKTASIAQRLRVVFPANRPLASRIRFVGAMSRLIGSRFHLVSSRWSLLANRVIVGSQQIESVPLRLNLLPGNSRIRAFVPASDVSFASFVGIGPVLPLLPPAFSYVINGTDVDEPVICTAPQMLGTIVPANSVFFLKFYMPTPQTQALLQDQSVVSMTFGIVGDMVTGQVYLRVLSESDSLFVQVTTLVDIAMQRWVVASQFP